MSENAVGSEKEEGGESFHEPNPCTSVTSRWVGQPVTRFVCCYMPYVRSILSPHMIQLVGCLCEVLAAFYVYRRLCHIQEGARCVGITPSMVLPQAANSTHSMAREGANGMISVWGAMLQARVLAVGALGLLSVSLFCYIWAPVYAHMEGLKTSIDPYFDECVYLVHSFLTSLMVSDLVSISLITNTDGHLNPLQRRLLLETLLPAMKCSIVWYSQLRGLLALLMDWKQRRQDAATYARKCSDLAARPRPQSRHPFYVFPPPPPPRSYNTPSNAVLRFLFDTTASVSLASVIVTLFFQLREERGILLAVASSENSSTPPHSPSPFQFVRYFPLLSSLPPSVAALIVVLWILMAGSVLYFLRIILLCPELDFVRTEVNDEAHRRHNRKGFCEYVLCMQRKRVWRVALCLLFSVWCADLYGRGTADLWTRMTAAATSTTTTIATTTPTTRNGRMKDHPYSHGGDDDDGWSKPEAMVAVGLGILVLHMDILWSSYRRDKVSEDEKAIMQSAPPSPTTLAEREANRRPVVLPPSLPVFDTSRLPQMPPACLLAAVVITLACNIMLLASGSKNTSSSLWPRLLGGAVDRVCSIGHQWSDALSFIMTLDLWPISNAAMGEPLGGSAATQRMKNTLGSGSSSSAATTTSAWMSAHQRDISSGSRGSSGDNNWNGVLWAGAMLPIWLCIHHLYALASHHFRVPVLRPVCNVLIDGLYDMCHIGHKRAMQVALSPWMAKYGGRYGRGGGNQLFCGVCGDEDSVEYKRLPMMTTLERVKEVESCGMAAVVIPNFPVNGIIEDIIRFYHIHRMLCGEEYDDKKETDIYYVVPRGMGILDTVPRTLGISSSELIQRIQGRAPQVK